MPSEYRDDAGGTGNDILSGAVDIGRVGEGGNGSGGTAPEPARTPGKRRGRPPGSGTAKGTGKEKTRHSLDLSSLTGLFVGIHVIAAGATGVPECAIDMKEGEDFMKAASNVMRHYSVESTQKTLDWLAFGGTCCMIYGTRFGAYMLRKREEHQISSRPAATVYQMPVKPSEQSNSSVKSVAQSEPPVSHIAPEMEFESED